MDYETARATTNADSNTDATALRPSIAIRTSMPSEVLRPHKQNNSSIGSVPELQSAFDYFTTRNQSPGPPTPGDPALPYGHYQANDIHLARNQDAPPSCFCPVNACTCPDRQAQFLPPTAFEFNTPGKTPERVTLAEEWNPEGLLVAAGFGEDDFNVNWDH